MSQENKTVFHLIREKAAAKVAVALLAAALLAGVGLAFPPGPTAPALAYPPGPGAPVNAR